MKIIDAEKLIDKIPGAVVTSGTFDGVHVGHQKILNGIAEQASRRSGNSVVLTFWPHPRFVLNGYKNDLKLLSTFEEKAKIIEASNIDYLVKLRFTEEFSKLHSEEFIQQVLIEKLGTQKLVIGYDHRFGKNREGGFDYLKENSNKFGFEVEEIPRQDIDNVGVSSTKIREALADGNVSTAEQYLGRPYELSGVVQEGDKIGTQIGFPTANVQINESYKLIPRNGVYAVRILVDGVYHNGMMNIGFRPTVQGNTLKLEVNIFDFSKDIYGCDLSVFFVERIRDEVKFDSLSKLKVQLSKDKLIATEILENHMISNQLK